MGISYYHTDWCVETVLYEEVGRRLKAARKICGFTQQELSERIKMSRPTLTNIENGIQKPSLYSIYEICNVLDIDIHRVIPSNKYNSPAV